MAMLPNIRELTPHQLSTVIREVKEWCACNGLLLKVPDENSLYHHVPITLLPTVIPKSLMDQAIQLQLDFNQLLEAIVRDRGFLCQNLMGALQEDEFSTRLFNIYRQVLDEGIAQPINFMLTRSDYMIQANQDDDKSQLCLKQVEFNTIAVGCAGVASIIPSLHRYVLRELEIYDESMSDKLRDNNVIEAYAEGIRTAWKMYGNDKAIILIVLIFNEKYVCDQRYLEEAIKQKDPSIKVIKCTLADIADNCVLGNDKTLYYMDKEVALTYYRTGYVPVSYPTEKQWEARLIVERSRCIKCPNIACHLAGVKKVQEVIANIGVLESLMSDKKAIERIRSTFVRFYSLQGEIGQESVAMAIKNPEKFVLKPPLEGGRNNFFGEDIRSFFKSATNKDQYSSYVLMDMIYPIISTNGIIKPSCSDVVIEDIVNELGIYGIYISNGTNQTVRNYAGGYLLKAKNVKEKEGRISGGTGGLDSVYLV